MQKWIQISKSDKRMPAWQYKKSTVKKKLVSECVESLYCTHFPSVVRVVEDAYFMDAFLENFRPSKD